MIPTPVARVDLHCHSTASQQAKLGVQRSLGLPECATPPEEVYELAKRRGMDFVTITDHDTIDGALAIADRPDVFVSEELTARFKGEPQAVHVLCWGITPDDHEWLQRNAGDVEACAEYLHGNDVACALAHPFFAVAAPLEPRHRRRLARLFPVWETRNGSRAPELNLPAATYIETHGGAGVGGSDDHAGVDVGRTWTETPPASTPQELLRRLRRGEATAGGEQGSAAKWAHAAMALAVRAIGPGDSEAPDPRVAFQLIERVVSEGDARGGDVAADLGPEHARALLGAWLRSLGLDVEPSALLAWMQEDGFSHAELERRARRAHDRRLDQAVDAAVGATGGATGGASAGALPTGQAPAGGPGGVSPPALLAAAGGLFEACVPTIPYVPAAAFLAKERLKLRPREGGSHRVALVADGIGAKHGLTNALQQVRELGVPGFEVEVIGTDARVDRRLPAVADVDVPLYPGLQLGVPSLPALADVLIDGRYDLVHLCSPGPAGVAAALIARTMGLPLVGTHHTELGRYAELRSGDRQLRAGMDWLLARLYASCQVVLSPSESSDASLRALAVPSERIARWSRGVDGERFRPRRRAADAGGGDRVTVLYAGRLSSEKGIDLLADAFALARVRDPRLHLTLAGEGPERERLRDRLGEHVTFLGWLEGEAFADAYAGADVFLFPSSTDTFGQVVLEAQASGVPVVAVDAGGPATLIEDGRTGLLRPAEAAALAAALCELAASPLARRRLADAALAAVGGETWQRCMGELGACYARALVDAGSARTAIAA